MLSKMTVIRLCGWLSVGIWVVACGSQGSGSQAAAPDPGHMQSSQPDGAVQPADGHEDALAAGNALWASGKLDLAEKKFRQAIEATPDASGAYSRLASLLLTENRTAEAIPLYQEAITRDPGNPKLFAALSIAYLHQAQYSMAQSMAEEALRLSPDMPQAKKLSAYIRAKSQALMVPGAAAGKLPEGGVHPGM